MKNLLRLRLIWLFMLFCMIPLWALSQNITVKGIVKDGAGESVIGASVLQFAFQFCYSSFFCRI